MEKLLNTLQAVGKAAQAYESPDGTRLLLLPYGARILGLYAPGSQRNFLWTNPDLKDAGTAKALFESDGWRNTGGDRTWLTPELDIFFPNYPNTDTHWAPRQLDADDYEVLKTVNGIGMSKRMTIDLARPKQSIELQLTKFVSPAPNPLRHERDAGQLMAIPYAGYTLKTSIELQDLRALELGQVGIWNLLQMPHGGDILVPTYAKTNPTVLFGNIPAEDLIAKDHLLTFRIRAAGEHKIAVRAVATTGRAGYLYQTGDEWAIVIRNSFVNPSGEYVDCPKSDPDDLGYSFHAVNVDSALGKFCEMEYHVPAIGKELFFHRSVDVSQVWAYRGAKEQIKAIARRLLSASA